MKKIVFVLSLIALTGSVVTSCSKDREEVATQKEDNTITKENLAASGRFVVTTYTLLDENGNVLKKVIPGGGVELGYYGATIFSKDGIVTVFEQKKSTDEIKEESRKYALEGNKLIIKGDDKVREEVYEIVKFVKGKYLKLKRNEVIDLSEKEGNVKVAKVLEFEVK